MTKFISVIFITSTILMTGCCNSSSKTGSDMEAKVEKEQNKVFPKGERINNSNFTGKVWLHDLVMPDSLNQNAVGSVTFEPGSRTKWHSHPAGQIILAIDGVGYYQEKGKPIEIIRKGESIKCPHNIPHWHGASPDSLFVQVAITGRENGQTIWYEEVTDEDYFINKNENENSQTK